MLVEVDVLAAGTDPYLTLSGPQTTAWVGIMCKYEAEAYDNANWPIVVASPKGVPQAGPARKAINGDLLVLTTPTRMKGRIARSSLASWAHTDEARLPND